MSVAESFVEVVTDGSLLLAMPVAAIAGLVSFLSPCVLPLVPGYLSFVTGLTGEELGDTRGRPSPTTTSAPDGDLLVQTASPVRRGRVLAGSLLFVAGFSAVFVTGGALFGGLGSTLAGHQRTVDLVLGVLTVALGLVFLGVLPGLQREVRSHWLPSPGLAGAPVLGVLFGVGWTPCLGPTLAAVQTLAYREASAGRGALLTAAYCIGLGVPFVLTGLAMRRALGAFEAVKRHYALVMRIGGGLLVLVGLLLVSGLWEDVMVELRGWVSGFETVV
jgi:cytochrome c-type biogenesis protein